MDIVRRLIKGGDFLGRHVVTCLPREIVQVKNLRLPQMPANELDHAVQFEARNVFAFDADESQIRYLHAGEVRQGVDARQEVIVLGAKDADVNNFIEQLHRCGVVVESLDFEPCALYRSVERFIRRREDEQEVHVLVEVGARRSQVAIGKGRDISFFKPIDIGGQQLQDVVVRKLGISPDEARTLRRRLIETPDTATEPAARRDPVRQAVFDSVRSTIEELGREISLCLRYYSVTFRGHRPSRLRLTGGEAADPQLQSILSACLPLPVEILKPLRNVDTSRMQPSDRRGPMSEWCAALGLALKSTREHFGDKDGKKRDPNAPRLDLRAPAEVVDLNGSIISAIPALTGGGGTLSQTSNTNAPAPAQEVLRA
jgi:type IV pilus assembly protein PilM